VMVMMRENERVDMLRDKVDAVTRENVTEFAVREGRITPSIGVSQCPLCNNTGPG
jgi:hypothetical protein